MHQTELWSLGGSLAYWMVCCFSRNEGMNLAAGRHKVADNSQHHRLGLVHQVENSDIVPKSTFSGLLNGNVQ